MTQCNLLGGDRGVVDLRRYVGLPLAAKNERLVRDASALLGLSVRFIPESPHTPYADVAIVTYHGQTWYRMLQLSTMLFVDAVVDYVPGSNLKPQLAMHNDEAEVTHLYPVPLTFLIDRIHGSHGTIDDELWTETVKGVVTNWYSLGILGNPHATWPSQLHGMLLELEPQNGKELGRKKKLDGKHVAIDRAINTGTVDEPGTLLNLLAEIVGDLALEMRGKMPARIISTVAAA